MHGAEVAHAGAGLETCRKRERRAHLAADGLAHLAEAALVDRGDLFEQREAFLARRRGESREGRAGGGNGAVDVRLGAERDLGEGLFGCGIDDVDRRRRRGRDPRSADEILHALVEVHARSPLTAAACTAMHRSVAVPLGATDGAINGPAAYAPASFVRRSILVL